MRRPRRATAQSEPVLPTGSVDFSYVGELALLQQVRRGLVEIAAGHESVRQRSVRLRRRASDREEQIQRVRGPGSATEAREAAQRRALARSELLELERLDAALRAGEDELGRAAQRLQARGVAFRARALAASGNPEDQEARARVAEAMHEVSRAVQGCEELARELRARADAPDREGTDEPEPATSPQGPGHCAPASGESGTFDPRAPVRERSTVRTGGAEPAPVHPPDADAHR
jgi:hypothetical protein